MSGIILNRCRGPAVLPVHWSGTDVKHLSVIVLWEHCDDVVSGGILEEAQSPGLSVLPPTSTVHAAVEHEEYLTVVTVLADIWNVDVTNLVHSGIWVALGELSLVESVEGTVVSMAEVSLHKGIVWIIEEMVEHVFCQVEATILCSTLVRRFKWWDSAWYSLSGARRLGVPFIRWHIDWPNVNKIS